MAAQRVEAGLGTTRGTATFATAVGSAPAQPAGAGGGTSKDDEDPVLQPQLQLGNREEHVARGLLKLVNWRVIRTLKVSIGNLVLFSGIIQKHLPSALSHSTVSSFAN